jgi:hypothetical protein
MFDEAIKNMGEAKASVYKEIEDSGAAITPTVAEAVRNFAMFLDSAYLWLGQTGHFVNFGGTAPAEGPAEAKAETVAGPDLTVVK